MSEHIAVKNIFADPSFNCRGTITPFDVMDLMKSIEQNGLIEPIIVQPYTANNGYKFRTIAGHRRLKACQLLKRETVEAIIRTDLTEQQAKIINFIENLERKNLTIMQEARAIEKFMGRFSYTEIGKMIGKSYGWVQTRIAALQLPRAIQDEIDSGLINQYQIKELFSLPTEDMQMKAVRDLKDAKLKGEKCQIISKERKMKVFNPAAMTLRNVTEIYAMQDLISEHFGHSLTTRVLGWCTGYVSTQDIYSELRKNCEQTGKTLIIPQSGES